MKVRCIEDFAVDKCDDDCTLIDGEYKTIEKGSMWEVQETKVRYIGGDIRLIGLDKEDVFCWLEIPKEIFELYFQEV